MKAMALAATALLAGCNAVFGIDEATLDDTIGMKVGAQSCVLNSDCATAQVCIFRVCSPPCVRDRDCEDEEALCIRTSEATACVRASDRACGSGEDCPDGTQCEGGECRSSCTPDDGDGCVPGQTCVGGVCRSAREDAGVVFAGDGGGDPPLGSDGETDGSPGGTDASADSGTGRVDAATGVPACEGGAQRCEGGVLYVCREDGAWDSGTSCAVDCIADACAVCVPGDVGCDGNLRRVCNDQGTWETSATCPVVCDEQDGCVDRCEPGTRQCSAGVDVLLCDDDGVYGPETRCDGLCMAGTCVGECRPDAATCMSAERYVCDANGEWQASPCVDQACTNGACNGVCKPGAKQCATNSSVQACQSDGNWGTATDCVDKACIGGVCTGSCKPGATRCSTGNTGVETCGNDGQWGAASSCGDQTCVGGSCTGECSPGAKQCSASSNGVQVCQGNGTWSAPAACNKTTCVSGVCTGECAVGDRQCSQSSNGVQSCQSNGKWGAPNACVNRTCVSGVCTGVCAVGDRQCDEGHTGVQACQSDGQWGSPSACPYVCVDATQQCGGECTPGSYACNNMSPSTSERLYCDAGFYRVDKKCNYPAELCQAGACGDNSPHTVGFASKLPESLSISANLLIGFPVTLTQRARLISFGMYGRAKANIKVKMALYSDSGGMPNTLLTVSDPVDLAEGTLTLPLVSASTLNPGRYWVMAIYNGTGGNFYGNTKGTSTSVYIAHDYLTPYPTTFPAGSAMPLPNYDLNHFLNVQDSL